MKRIWVLISVSCILSVAGFVSVQGRLDQIRPPREQLKEKLIYIPEAQFIKTASLGFHAALADIMWARAVVYFGHHYLTDKDYKWLYRLLDATTSLDPKNILAYRFGGTMLALGEGDVGKSIELLKKGIRNNPDEDWRLYFLLGFNYFFYQEDYASAAEYLEKASRMPGHPEYLPRLTARLYAKAEKIDTALKFLIETYRHYEDESVKETVKRRIEILAAKKYAASLRHVIERYKEIYGEYPTDVGALADAGLVKELLVYPDGQYSIDPDTGMVDWISELDPQWP
jgi:tetratricopeptide (TPR) repeat protein